MELTIVLDLSERQRIDSKIHNSVKMGPGKKRGKRSPNASSVQGLDAMGSKLATVFMGGIPPDHYLRAFWG